jgi:glycine/D-amino acid oxidase-like deaminating enzyme
MARIAVIGGGIAGRCVAAALGVDVDLYDRPGPRASDVPAAICHRFPGRTFDPPEHQSRAYLRTVEWFHTYPLGVEPIRILRKPNRRLARSLTRIAPGVAVSESDAGFEYGGAWVVDMPLWLTQLPSAVKTHRVDAALDTTTGLMITTDIGAQEYDHVVICPGASLSDWLPTPEVQVVEGEIAFFSGQIDKAHFGGAHVYPAGGSTAIGHTFLDGPRPDDEALDELRLRAEGDGHSIGASISVWRGARSVIHPDRLPVLTQIRPNVFVLGGLGAKGLLYAPYLAEAIAAKILRGEDLPQEFTWPRLPRPEG